MIPACHPNATHELGAPSGWDEAEHGKCAKLMVRIEGEFAETLWEPTPDELAILNAGGHVVLCIKGGQPAVKVSARPRSQLGKTP